jgi:hypothetical protein
MGFVPVKFGLPDAPGRKLDGGNAFEFTPPPFAIPLSQTADFSNGSANGDGFDVRNLAEYFEAH